MATSWDLRGIAKSTIKYSQEVKERFPVQVNSSIDNTRVIKAYSELSAENHKLERYIPSTETCKVHLVNGDTIDCALWLKSKGTTRPLLLNMASNWTPGGGWHSGAMAQEEELFRRTTYTLAMEQPRIKNEYPLPPLAGVYSPNVIVFRGGYRDNYYLYDWDQCEPIDFIAVPAVRHPKLEIIDDPKAPRGYREQLRANDMAITRQKICLMFEAGIYYSHDTLVLGAFGNGVFGNPPQCTAEIFRNVIGLYEKFFKNIVFAILRDKNSKYDNLQTYKQVLKPDTYTNLYHPDTNGSKLD